MCTIAIGLLTVDRNHTRTRGDHGHRLWSPQPSDQQIEDNNNCWEVFKIGGEIVAVCITESLAQFLCDKLNGIMTSDDGPGVLPP